MTVPTYPRTHLTVLKLGGELIEAPADLARTADAVAALARMTPLAIVHGGGKAIDAALAARGIAPVKRDGIRVTDAATLGVAVGVLAGTTNTALVAALSARGIRAVGLTGADAALGLSVRVEAMQTTGGSIDPGLVGQPVPSSGLALVSELCAAGYLPVIASIGVTCDGALLNVNADVMAAHVAASCVAARLLVAGSTPGVIDGSGATIERLDEASLDAMIADGTATAGMIAKLVACRAAFQAGVADVRIVDGRAGGFLSGTALSTRHEAPHSARSTQHGALSTT
jgi:acetylglutamate kinase